MRTGPHASRTVGWFASILAAIVLVLIACATQRFSVVRVHRENLALEERLERLREDVRRAEADVAALSRRERIEAIASLDLGLASPGPEALVFLPEWESAPEPNRAWGSLVATTLGRAGRSLGHLGGYFGGKGGCVRPRGGGR